jgi:transposase-like protein
MQRKKIGAEFKAKVALEAIRGQRSLAEIASEYDVHPNQVGQWKKEVVDNLAGIFSGEIIRKTEEDDKLKEQLYSQIGQLKVEVDWLKKKTGIKY